MKEMKIDNSEYREEMTKFCSVKIDISCKNCEYAYAGMTRKNTKRGCEIEDLGIDVPQFLNESRHCSYWERKGSRFKIENIDTSIIGMNLKYFGVI